MSKPLIYRLLGLVVLFVAACFVAGLPTSVLRSSMLGGLGGCGLFLALPILTGKISLRSASAGAREKMLAGAEAPVGQALLYVYRGGYMGMTANFEVELDGRLVAKLKCPRYTRLAIAPGEHRLRSGPKGLAGKTNTPGEASFRAAAGETVVFAVSSEATGFTARTVLARQADVPGAMERMAAMTFVQTI